MHSRVTATSLNRSSASDVLTVELFDAGALDLSGTKAYAVTVAEYGSSNATAANVAVTAVNFTFVGTPLVTQTGSALVVLFTPVPEPAVVLGLAAAGLGLAGWARRRSSPTARDRSAGVSVARPTAAARSAEPAYPAYRPPGQGPQQVLGGCRPC